MNRVFYIIIFVLVSALCFILGRTTKRDTVASQVKEVVIIDTLRIETPEYIYHNVIDTILVPIEKTTYLHDTLYVALPREEKTYKGEDYLARISGFQPSLDYIETYPKTTTITETITQSVIQRNSLGIGLDMNYSSHPDIPIYLEYSYLLHKNVEMSARLQFDLPSQEIGFGLGAKISIGW